MLTQYGLFYTVVLPFTLILFLFSAQGQGSCVIGCCCYPFMSGCYRSGVQRTLGVADSGCLLNCCIHIYLYVAKITSLCVCEKSRENCDLRFLFAGICVCLSCLSTLTTPQETFRSHPRGQSYQGLGQLRSSHCCARPHGHVTRHQISPIKSPPAKDSCAAIWD